MRYWLIYLMLLASSCASRKNTGSSPASAAAKPSALQSELQAWPSRWWSAKGKLSLTMNGNTFPLNLTLRAEEGKAIWFSASAFGLLEVGRGRIDGDSIRVLDKINNRCVRSGLNGLENYLPSGMGIKQLQHFIMGRVFWDSLVAAKSTASGDTSSFHGRQGNVGYRAKVLQKYQLLEARADLGEGSNIQLNNSDFRVFSGFPVCFRKELQSRIYRDGKETQGGLKIDFSRFEFLQQAPDMEFSLPADCQPMELK